MNIIGRSALVDISQLNLNQLPAKVDTGAYSSSIDHSLAQVVTIDGLEQLEFILFHPGSKWYTGHKLTTAEFEITEVKNANGVQKRYVIFPDIQIGKHLLKSRLTLANRDHLRYPILIGRKFLNQGDYLVDVKVNCDWPGDEEERNL